MKILLADHRSATEQEDLLEDLTASGITVIRAASGELAMAMTLHERPDLIMVNMNLQPLSGDETVTILKAHPKTGRIPVVGIVEDGTEAAKERAMKAGCNAVVQEQVQLEAFIRQMVRLL